MHPTIINNTLSNIEGEKLLGVLRENKEALGWKVSDLKGEEFKLIVQPQR